MLSLPDATMVLGTAGDLQQITDSGFNTAAPTVLVEPVCDGRLIAQVCLRRARCAPSLLADSGT